MRVLVLTKRRISRKDVLQERHGRIFELSRGVAQAGHEVSGIAVGYRNEPKAPTTHLIDGDVTVRWQAFTFNLILPWHIFSAVSQHIEHFQPHVLWCSGDAFQVIAGVRLGQRHGIPVVCDLYDNYEAFLATRIPGVTHAFRRALHTSDGVTCVSEPLARFVRESYRFRGPIEVIENGVHAEVFQGMSRLKARAKLGMPRNAILIGTAGSLRKRRGLVTLLNAFRQVRREVPGTRLLLAGPLDRHAPPPSDEGVYYLGELDFTEMPVFLASLDVGVILNRDTAFGRFCYPLKLPEMLAARIPIVAAAVGATGELFSDHEQSLFSPDDANDLASKLIRQCRNPARPPLTPLGWPKLSRKLSDLLRRVVSDAAPNGSSARYR